MKARLLAVAWVIIGASSACAEQIPPDSAPDLPSATHPLLLQPPKTPDEIPPRVQLAEERLAALRPSTQPATQPSDPAGQQLIEAQTALWSEWNAYLGQLQKLAAAYETISTLSSPAHVEALSRKLEELEQQTAEIRRRPIPRRPDAERVAEAAGRLKELEAQRAALSELQARRAAQLATGFDRQRESLESELRELRQARQQTDPATELPPAGETVEQELRRLGRRLLDVQIARLELALQVLARETKQTQLAHRQDERQLEAVQQHVLAFGRWVNQMTEAGTRGVLEGIALEREQATEALDIALLDLEYFCEAVRLNYFASPKILGSLRDRFPPSALARLQERVSSSAALCAEVVSLAEYWTGRDVAGLRSELRQQRSEFRDELAVLRQALGRTVSELHQLYQTRERTWTQFRSLSSRLTQAAESASAAERTRLDTRLPAMRSSLQEAIQTTLREAQELESRLRDALSLVREQLTRLRDAEDQLYWVVIKRRESGLAGLQWRKVGEEFRQLLGGETPTERTARSPAATEAPAVSQPAVSAILTEILSPTPDVRAKLGARLSTLRLRLSQCGWTDWLRGALLMGLAFAAGFLLRRQAGARVRRARHALATVRSAPDGRHGGWPLHHEGRQMGQRLREPMHLLGWQTVRDAAYPILFGTALCLAVWLADLGDNTPQVLAMVVATGVGLHLLLRLLRHLFHQDADRRLICCPDATAHHYRFWGRALLALLAVLLPVWVVLSGLEVMPATAELLREIAKTGLLLVMLAFLVRRGRVVVYHPDRQRQWWFTLFSALYPLPVGVVAALLALQIIGYGLLAEYLGRAILASAAVLIVAGVLVRYLCELVDDYAPVVTGLPAEKCSTSEGKTGQDACSTNPTSVAAPSGGEQPHDSDWPAEGIESGAYVVRLTKTLLRAAGLLLSAAVILHIWGAAGWLHAYDWWKVAIPIALVIIGGLMVDRVMLTAVRALHLSGRLPHSTANIIRRWLRGLLTVVIILVCVTLAGYELEVLWAPLAGLLAMIAIGFVAVWSLLSNVLATLLILIWRPFNVGERITLQPDGISGQVADINFMYTLLRSDGGSRIAVPNALFLQRTIQRQQVGTTPVRSLAEQLDADRPVGE